MIDLGVTRSLAVTGELSWPKAKCQTSETIFSAGVQLNDRFMDPTNRYTPDICYAAVLMTYQRRILKIH